MLFKTWLKEKKVSKFRRVVESGVWVGKPRKFRPLLLKLYAGTSGLPVSGSVNAVVPVATLMR